MKWLNNFRTWWHLRYGHRKRVWHPYQIVTEDEYEEGVVLTAWTDHERVPWRTRWRPWHGIWYCVPNIPSIPGEEFQTYNIPVGRYRQIGHRVIFEQQVTLSESKSSTQKI